MLPGKRDTVALYTGDANEKLPITMKVIERVLKLVKCSSSDGITVCNVAEFEKC